jgi:hypothetical protein
MSERKRDDDKAKEQAIIEAAAKALAESPAFPDWKSLMGTFTLKAAPGLNILSTGNIGNPWHQQTHNWWFNPSQAASPTVKPRVLPVEHSTEVVTGYRIWPLSRSYPEGYRLRAVNACFDGTVTPNQRIEAKCKAGYQVATLSAYYGNVGVDPAMGEPQHQAPGKDCHCGIYAYKRSVPLEDSDKPYVAGEVNMWGRVIEHADGYRAQFAYPKRLFVVDGGERAQHIAVALGLAYGVPCEVWDG